MPDDMRFLDGCVRRTFRADTKAADFAFVPLKTRFFRRKPDFFGADVRTRFPRISAITRLSCVRLAVSIMDKIVSNSPCLNSAEDYDALGIFMAGKTQKQSDGSALDFEAQLWAAADKMRRHSLDKVRLGGLVDMHWKFGMPPVNNANDGWNSSTPMVILS